ncbi:hypothetical protein GOP47_0030170 [Adiantum capillus-veneris]|nr:hypothetical protein GOP47_0030170 [Adiantum capillus-veneris]
MATSDEATVYIVYLERQCGSAPEALEASHLETLTSVLGSEEAARASLLYSYKTAANGFSAKLTPSQASVLKEKPGVLQVVPSQTYQLQKQPISKTSMT